MTIVKKNFILGIVSEAFWGAGFGLYMPPTLLNLALVDLGGSAVLAGFLVSIFATGINLPQAFSALTLPPKFSDPPRAALLHIPALLGPLVSGLSFLLIPASDPSARLVGFLSGFALFSFGIGLVVPHWVTGISRCLPEKLRGRYFGTSFFASGLCAASTGWLGARWVSQGGLEWGYACCFLSAVPFMVMSLVVLSFMKPVTARPKAQASGAWKKSFHLLSRKLQEPGPFRVGLALVFLLILVAASGNLFTVYLREVVKVEAGSFQFLAPALSLGAMAGAFLLGWLSDRKGLRIAYGVAFSAGVLSMLLISCQGIAFSTLAFGALGFLESAFPVLGLVLVLKLAVNRDAPVQTGLFNTLMSPWNFLLPLAVGTLAARAGYSWAFTLGGVCCLAALGILWRYKDFGKGKIAR